MGFEHEKDDAEYDYVFDIDLSDLEFPNYSSIQTIVVDITGSKVISDDTDAGVDGVAEADPLEFRLSMDEILQNDGTFEFSSYAYSHYKGGGIQEWITARGVFTITNTLEISMHNKINAYNRGNHLANTAGQGYGYAGVHKIEFELK